MKLKQFILCATAIVLPLSVNAASGKNKDRWFEIEVILFSQLGDKSQLKEHFPESSELPKYRRTLDLLADYLNPDISSLKQLLPDCESPYYPADLVSQNAKLPTLFEQKSLTEIEQLATQLSEPLNSLSEVNYGANDVSDDTNITALPESDITSNTISLDDNGINNLQESPANLQLNLELSEEERAKIQTLVTAAEQEFSHYKFQYTPRIVDKRAKRTWCRIDEQHFAVHKANDSRFDYNGFSIDKMPLTINAAEDVTNNHTHLLSKESLKLGDVITDLRYSKNFRPILHMGWRQVARPKKQSTAVKVYAGDNFAADHQKQLESYQYQQAELLKSHADNENMSSSDEQPAINITETKKLLLEQAKKERIASIVSQIATVPTDTDILLSSIENDDLTLSVDDTTNSILSETAAPIAPVQDWFIDGLFNVHLKHYLFITADFNILDKNLAELATAKLTHNSETNAENSLQALPSEPIQAKAIRFKQNRRVISGEVHYFDHPYMGMIVQIRPYKKPKNEQRK